jgi:hypothetical protein
MLRRIELDRGVRLFGISVSGFGAPAEQLRLDDLLSAPAADGPSAREGLATPARAVAAHEWEAASETIDTIRGRFGSASIGPASSLAGEPGRGLKVVRPGSQQWGPDRPAPDRPE